MYRTLPTRSKALFTLPIRPPTSSLPSNLARPALGRPGSVGSALPSRFGLARLYATKEAPKGAGAGAKGPSPGPDPKTAGVGEGKPAGNREDQNSTSGAGAEIRDMTRDFARIIQGGSPESAALGAREVSAHGHGGSITEDFLSITKGSFTAVPKPVLMTGLAGTIPYLGTSASIVVLAREASLASQAGGESPAGLDLNTALSYLHTMEHIQITYGAIILSFLGALHWGMEFSKLGGEHGYKRLAIGIFPVIFAWPTLAMTHGVALATQWFGFTFMWFLDQKATSQGWTTWWYSTYRFYLSIVVGFSIIGTLVGTSYYGAGAGAITDAKSPHLRHTTERTSALKRLDKVKEKNFPSSPNTKVDRVEGTTSGDVSVEEEQSGEAFLKLRNPKREEEERQATEKRQKEQEEKEKKKKEQDEKENKQKKESPDGMKDGQKNRSGAADEKKEDKKEEKKDDKKEEKKDDKKDEGAGDKSSEDKQKAAQEEKGAAGEENKGMK